MRTPSKRTACLASAVFHVGLAAALAAQAPLRSRPLEVRAGEDSVESRPLAMSLAWAEPRLLATPVLISPDRVQIAGRELLPVPPERVRRELPLETFEVRLAESLLSRLAPPAPLPPPKPAPTPSPPPASASSPAPPPASRSSSSAAGAESEPPRQVRVVPPLFLDARPPVFPTEALERGWTGVVMLRITVDQFGRVAAVTVAESSGHAVLDASAVRAVRTWRGRPATRDGAPYRSTWKQPVRFQ